MSAHDPAFLPGRVWTLLWAMAERFNRWPVRAMGRGLGGSLPVGALISVLSDFADTTPGSDERLVDLGLAGVLAGVFLWLLRRFGQGRGIGYGIKLTLVSWFFWQSLVAAAYAAWLAAGVDGTPIDWEFIGFLAAMSAGLCLPTSVMLCRLDPDF